MAAEKDKKDTGPKEGTGADIKAAQDDRNKLEVTKGGATEQNTTETEGTNGETRTHKANTDTQNAPEEKAL